MRVFVSEREMTEIAESLVSQRHGRLPPERVDIYGIATEILGLPVYFERFATPDQDCIGFTSNGKTPLPVWRDGQVVDALFPNEAIVLDWFLQKPSEQNYLRFTLAHEVGHVLLRRADPLCQPACFNRLHDSERRYCFDDLKKRMQLEESQANTMAAALLMPYESLAHLVWKYADSAKLPVYGRAVFLPETKIILHKIGSALGVSYTALLIQLRKYKLLHYESMERYFERQRSGGQA